MGTPTVLAYISYNVCLRGLDPAAPQHAQAHAHKQTHAQTHIHTRAHTRTRTCKHTHSHTHSHTHTHTPLPARNPFLFDSGDEFPALIANRGGRSDSSLLQPFSNPHTIRLPLQGQVQTHARTYISVHALLSACSVLHTRRIYHDGHLQERKKEERKKLRRQ